MLRRRQTVLLAEPDASAWKRAGISAGDHVQAVQWSGSLVSIDVASTRLKTEAYPEWDPWQLMAVGLAAAVAAGLLYASSAYRQMALIDTAMRGFRRRGLRVDLWRPLDRNRAGYLDEMLSPRARARLSGVFEALEGLPAVFGQTIVLGMLVVNGDPAATAHNILANEGLYRLGFAIPLLAVGFHVTWALLIYQLFGVVNRTINQLALYIILIGCAIQAVAAVVYLSPLVVLQSDAHQGDLAMLLINMSRLTFDVYIIFFGLWCVLLGYLIVRSTFMPRVIGALLILDGIGWMTFLVPPFAASIYTLIAVVAGVAEFSLLLWMLIFGVSNERWREQEQLAGKLTGAAAAAASC